ncbi:MAG TPA: pitrilysin family protein, partial [Gemmatimonadales bacterium]|nr:pitrilysin family protein [Gemmatimonadales bacterium]
HLIDEEYARMLGVSAEDVRRAAARYLVPDAASAVAYLPRNAGEDLDAGRLRGAFDAAPITVPVRSEPAIGVPTPRPASGRSVAGVEHVRLPGADLLVRRRPGTPLTTLGVYFPRQGWESAADAGIAALTMRSLIRGAGERDAAQLALASERLGGSLNPVTNADWVGLGITAIAGRTGAAAALLHSVLTTPRFDPESVDVERGLLLEEARQQVDDMVRYPFQLAFRGAFGEAGYGLPVGGTLESLAALDATRVRRWHQTGVPGTRPVIVAVGDGALDRLVGELAGVFGDWTPAAASGPRVPPTWQVRNSAHESVVTRDKRQTAIAMAFPGPERRAADRAAAEVWAAVASGLGGRLFEALRDRRSLAYTVIASAWARAAGGALITYIATTPEREEEARSEMLKELGKFTAAPPSAAELTQAQNYLAGQAEVSRQSASALAAEVVEAWIAGRGLEELEDPGAEYRAVTAEEVLAVAREHLDPARRAEGVVRGRVGG